MLFEPWLRAVRRLASSAFEHSWHCGFLVSGRLLNSRARPWSSSGAERALIIAPHPDDEVIACSGAILRHLESGDQVRIVIATDGRRSRAAPSPNEMASIRKNEATRAAQRLGIDRLEWLGLPEGDWQVSELQSILSELLRRHSPTVVYAPSRIDFHPEHLAVAHSLARAFDSAAVAPGDKPRVRVYQVQVPLTRILTNVVADVSGVLAQSFAALRAYESQAGSIECAYRRGRYGALLHRALGPVEEFWELSAEQYADLHRTPPAEWLGKFRGLRRFAWTDPLAYLVGNAERRRLLMLATTTAGARSTA